MINFLSAVDSLATEPVKNAAADAAEQTMSLWELFNAGGWLMWILLALGGIAIFIFVERFVAIRKATGVDMHLSLIHI